MHNFSNAAMRNNPALVQLLGLCPLLAVSNTVVNALGLAAASLFVVVGSNVLISLSRHHIPEAARLPMFVLIIATLTTLVVMLLEAFAYALYLKIALFVQIIVTNCMILGRAEQFASRQPVWAATLDGLGTGCGFALALLTLGTIREALGSGTLLKNAEYLFGPGAADWQISLGSQGWFPLASYAPGAFIVAGVTFALLRSLNERRQTKTDLQPPARGES
ncbi:MAG: electron transport complex subunit RsxE [Pseudomonadales bacterium]